MKREIIIVTIISTIIRITRLWPSSPPPNTFMNRFFLWLFSYTYLFLTRRLPHAVFFNTWNWVAQKKGESWKNHFSLLILFRTHKWAVSTLDLYHHCNVCLVQLVKLFCANSSRNSAGEVCPFDCLFIWAKINLEKEREKTHTRNFHSANQWPVVDLVSVLAKLLWSMPQWRTETT